MFTVADNQRPSAESHVARIENPFRAAANQPSLPYLEPTYKIATTTAERQAAFHLVYKSYLQSGLTQPNEYQMRVTPYHLLPTTEVFVATLDHQVISTVTLIVDGDKGLPLESMYPQEVAERRAAGILMGEVSCLADRRSSRKRFFEVFCKLTRLMVQYARRRGVDQLLIVCHPKHARFYERYLAFQNIGGLTSCPHAENHPAIALCLDFDYVDRHPPEAYARYFGEQIPDAQLRPQPISAQERQYLERILGTCYQPLAPLDEQLKSSSDGMTMATV